MTGLALSTVDWRTKPGAKGPAQRFACRSLVSRNLRCCRRSVKRSPLLPLAPGLIDRCLGDRLSFDLAEVDASTFRLRLL